MKPICVAVQGARTNGRDTASFVRNTIKSSSSAGCGAELQPQDMLRLVTGPLWLNILRVSAAAMAALLLDARLAVSCMLVVALASAIVGSRWSRSLVWQPKLGFPIAFDPSPRFIVPVAI